MLLGADGANRSPLSCFDSGRCIPTPFSSKTTPSPAQSRRPLIV